MLFRSGFDPVQPGHLDLFCAAKALGDKLVVILNSDEFLISKKGYYFIPSLEREVLVHGYSWVDAVVLSRDINMTACKTLTWLKPDVFANGGDRTSDNIPESEVCKQLGIEMVFNVGGRKVASSSGYMDRMFEFWSKNKNKVTAEEKDLELVYARPKGGHYHTNRNCSLLRGDAFEYFSYKKISIREAKKRKLAPCACAFKTSRVRISKGGKAK